MIFYVYMKNIFLFILEYFSFVNVEYFQIFSKRSKRSSVKPNLSKLNFANIISQKSQTDEGCSPLPLIKYQDDYKPRNLRHHQAGVSYQNAKLDSYHLILQKSL